MPWWLLVPVVLVVLIAGASGWATQRVLRRQAQALRQLAQLARTDDLTGLPNRRAFQERLAQEIARAQRYQRPLSLVLLDLHAFKAVNDTYGHAVGDQALTALGGVLRGLTREADLVARLGGDEFALLLPETDAPAAAQVVQRLQAVLARWPLALGGGPSPPVVLRLRANAGAATVSALVDDAAALVAAADQALYRDKRGRET